MQSFTAALTVTAALGTAVVLVAGCAATATDPGYMASAAYQGRPELAESLFPSDQQVMDDEAIRAALESRISLPDHARLAMLQLHDRPRWSVRSDGLTQTSDQIIARQFEQLRTCDRIADVAVLPALLVPGKPTVPALREAGARFQAHLLLIYRVRPDTFGKSRVFAADTAKCYCAVDAVLIDVRTGIVPFAAVATGTYETKGSRGDVSYGETRRRAELQAVGQALDEITAALTAYLQSVP